MSNDLVECCECGKEVEYSDAYSTIEQDTGFHWYYCRDCYGVDLGDYDHQAEEAPQIAEDT